MDLKKKTDADGCSIVFVTLSVLIILGLSILLKLWMKK